MMTSGSPIEVWLISEKVDSVLDHFYKLISFAQLFEDLQTILLPYFNY